MKRTSAYQTLERLYLERARLTLFDFDGYDHRQLGMSLKDVINCPSRICGHAFILAMILMYGSEFRIDHLPTVDHTSRRSGQQTASYSIKIVNLKTFKGNAEYVGRTMPGLAGSPLGNQYKVRPHGPYTREESVLTLYRRWLWKEMQNKQSPAYLEVLRWSRIAENQELILSCWCAPALCHATIIKSAIAFLKQNER